MARLPDVFLCLSLTFSPMQFLRVDQDKECNMECSGAPRKPLCASDGRTFTSRCEFLRAKCRDPQLEVIRGPCKGQVTSHASATPDDLKCAERVTVETCGLNSFQHNWFFECWEDEWGWHTESGWRGLLLAGWFHNFKPILLMKDMYVNLTEYYTCFVFSGNYFCYLTVFMFWYSGNT